jgi:hypothetical protein
MVPPRIVPHGSHFTASPPDQTSKQRLLPHCSASQTRPGLGASLPTTISTAALQLLLPKVLRRMARLVVNVDVSTLNIRQRLDLDLQRFGAVVRLLDGLALVDDDVDFDDQAWARVPGADGVEGKDHGVVGHRWENTGVSFESESGER